MSRVWKPVRDPPTLSRYISLSEDAQQLMAALEKTYNNQQKKPSQCNATPENPVPGYLLFQHFAGVCFFFLLFVDLFVWVLLGVFIFLRGEL